MFHGGGRFGDFCQSWFCDLLNAKMALMTTSCSLALDLSMLLADLETGDEVLVPDFAFVTTAQCVALRGAVPVFCDIRPDTLNIDERRLEEALTPKTKAIIVIHYGAVCAEMDAINSFAQKHNLLVVEDAAQAIGATYHARYAGCLGDMAAFSFHATKNIQCAEGGMLVVNQHLLQNQAPIIWEKGTDRQEFLKGRIEKYQWRTLGTSIGSELNAAMLSAQLEMTSVVAKHRNAIWQKYHDAFVSYSQSGLIDMAQVPEHCYHNGHLFYLILPDCEIRNQFLDYLRSHNIQAAFHYQPLHESTGGQKYGRKGMDMPIATTLPHRLVRLPLYYSLSPIQQDRIISVSTQFLDNL